ncbi:hypothetical protein [Halobacteriovorax sp. HLS]|uniref:hypothetical protein n=1 Tax=Halobacteriovorax sp. HLS TaxID=2234000 RepID=UPI000FDC543C|nr:hypothetical protein [Halobacteriovorax sp. HLS]
MLSKSLKTIKLFSIFTVLIMGIANTLATENYDVVKRFKLLEDKFKTMDMLNAPGHDFYLDIGALVNKNLTGFIDEAKEVDKASNALTAAQDFLRKYDKTEQNARLRFGLGFPLPSFTIMGAKIRPSVRTRVGVGVLMGIRSKNFTPADALEFLPSDLDPSIKAVLDSCNYSSITGGQDLVQYAVTNCGLDSTLAAPYLNKYYYPNDTTVPVIYNYVQGEGRAGLYFDYNYEENWFGSFNLYGLGRADLKMIVSDQTLAGKEEIADFGDDLNTTVNLTTDLKFGYKNKSLRTFAAIEEIQLATMTDNEQKAGKVLYGESVLFRLHGEYIYTLSNFDVKAFGGAHHRSGYGLGDGYYLGADLRLHVWEERMKLRFRGMIDGEHFTFAPMLDLWLLRLEYVLKQPLSSEYQGVKPSRLHALNFRLEF